MLFINKLFNSIACLLYFINLQLVIPGRTWILLYLGRTVYKRLWACLALYTSYKKNKLSYQEVKSFVGTVGYLLRPVNFKFIKLAKCQKIVSKKSRKVIHVFFLNSKRATNKILTLLRIFILWYM